MLIKQPRRPSRSVVNNGGRTVHAAHFHFHRNTDTSPRHHVVCQPLHDTHRVGVESLTEPHVEHCITHTQRARARAGLSRKREKWKQELGKSNRFVLNTRMYFHYARKICATAIPTPIPLLVLRANDSEVPSNFISKADVKVGLSNVMPLLGRVDSL